MRFLTVDSHGVILGAFKTYTQAERFAAASRSRDNQVVRIVDTFSKGAMPC